MKKSDLDKLSKIKDRLWELGADNIELDELGNQISEILLDYISRKKVNQLKRSKAISSKKHNDFPRASSTPKRTFTELSKPKMNYKKREVRNG